MHKNTAHSNGLQRETAWRRATQNRESEKRERYILEKGRENTGAQQSKEGPTAQTPSTQRRNKKDSAANHSEVNSETQTKNPDTITKRHQQI